LARFSIVAAVLGVCVLVVAGWLALRGGDESPQPTATRSAASTTTGPAPKRSTSGGEAGGGPVWPYAKLIDRLEGRRLVVGGRTVRLDRGLLTCSGTGRAVVRGGTRHWRRFICTQTTFANGVDRDVSFDVAVGSGDRLVTSSARWGPD
jgi:hypothetical protein